MEILPVFDNLKTALIHFDKKTDDNSWAEGIKHVVKQFQDVLKNMGVLEIETKNKKFNPNEMDAMEGEGERVVEEVRSGYMLNGKVIVPAKVILGSSKA